MLITRRDAMITGLGLAAGMALTPTRAWARPTRRSRDDGAFFPWSEVAPGLHAIVDPQTGGNCLLIVGSDAAALVDTKYPAVARALLRESNARGAPLRHVINTHHHGDHTGGNFAFNAAGIEVIAHPKAEPRILANFDQYVAQVGGGPRFVGGLERPTQPQVLDEAGKLTEQLAHMDASDWGPSRLMHDDRVSLTVGGRTVELTHFGQNAHTDNDTVVFLPDANVLHTGDLVFSGLHPYFDPSAGVTAKGWIAVLGKVRALCDKDTVVIPGHGATGDATIIDAQRDYLRRLIDAVQADIDAGLSKDAIAAKSWDFMDGLGFEQVRPRAINAVYDELTAG